MVRMQKFLFFYFLLKQIKYLVSSLGRGVHCFVISISGYVLLLMIMYTFMNLEFEKNIFSK